MKKKIDLFLKVGMIVVSFALCCSCFTSTKKVSPIPKGTATPTPIPKEEYVDDNPISIGLYSSRTSGRELVENYNSEWTLNKDIAVFSSLPTHEKEVSSSTLKTVWQEYWQMNSGTLPYKIGYSLKFTLQSENSISQTILKPIDAASFYDYLQVYLYDDIHQTPGVRYSHIEGDINSDTMITTIKMTGSTLTHEINSPIELSVFTYNDAEDFDSKNGQYRGKSLYTVRMHKTN